MRHLPGAGVGMTSLWVVVMMVSPWLVAFYITTARQLYRVEPSGVALSDGWYDNTSVLAGTEACGLNDPQGSTPAGLFLDTCHTTVLSPSGCVVVNNARIARTGMTVMRFCGWLYFATAMFRTALLPLLMYEVAMAVGRGAPMADHRLGPRYARAMGLGLRLSMGLAVVLLLSTVARPKVPGATVVSEVPEVTWSLTRFEIFANWSLIVLVNASVRNSFPSSLFVGVVVTLSCCDLNSLMDLIFIFPSLFVCVMRLAAGVCACMRLRGTAMPNLVMYAGWLSLVVEYVIFVFSGSLFPFDLTVLRDAATAFSPCCVPILLTQNFICSIASPLSSDTRDTREAMHLMLDLCRVEVSHETRSPQQQQQTRAPLTPQEEADLQQPCQTDVVYPRFGLKKAVGGEGGCDEGDEPEGVSVFVSIPGDPGIEVSVVSDESFAMFSRRVARKLCLADGTYGWRFNGEAVLDEEEPVLSCGISAGDTLEVDFTTVPAARGRLTQAYSHYADENFVGLLRAVLGGYEPMWVLCDLLNAGIPADFSSSDRTHAVDDTILRDRLKYLLAHELAPVLVPHLLVTRSFVLKHTAFHFKLLQNHGLLTASSLCTALDVCYVRRNSEKKLRLILTELLHQAQLHGFSLSPVGPVTAAEMLATCTARTEINTMIAQMSDLGFDEHQRVGDDEVTLFSTCVQKNMRRALPCLVERGADLWNPTQGKVPAAHLASLVVPHAVFAFIGGSSVAFLVDICISTAASSRHHTTADTRVFTFMSYLVAACLMFDTMPASGGVYAAFLRRWARG